MVVVQVGLAPLLNIVTVCGMRMHAKHEQRTISNRPRCYAKSPTAQDVFWPIPGLISCARVTGSMQEIELICQENSHCRVLVQPKAEKLLGACGLMYGKQSYLFSLEKLFHAKFTFMRR